MTTIQVPSDTDALTTIAAIQEIEARGLPELPGSTFALLERSARLYGTQTAITFFATVSAHRHPERYSYRDLLEAVTRTANLFESLGLGAGDVIAIVLPNLPETHFALWGAQATGLALPINPMLEAPAIADLLHRSGAKAVVTTAPSPGSDLYQKVVSALGEAPGVTRLVLVDADRAARGASEAVERVGCGDPGIVTIHYDQALAEMPGDALKTARVIGGGDIAALFCTGGTTGAPKLAQHTHANEVVNAWMTARAFGHGYQSGDTALCGLPVFHVNAAVVSGLAAFYAGVNVLLATPQGFRGPHVVERFWEIAAHHRIAAFSGVPTLFTSLLQQPTAGHDLSSLKFALCAASPMSPELQNRVEDATGLTIVEAYGLTEATCTVSMNPLFGERRTGSVGLPIPFQDIRIVLRDADGGLVRAAEPGEIGSVVVAGPNVFAGYLSERHNVGLWVDLGDGRRWLDTGDLGLLDPDGYLWLKGRTKDLIIRGGHNIDPAMIEDAFYAHPAVAMAAAIGRPDSYAGEVPVVYVQLKEGQGAAAAELTSFARSRIHERPAWPKAVIIVDALPLTAVGKVFKPTLRQQDLERVQSEGALDA
jgi:fatty-acyl-CoA synthase